VEDMEKITQSRMTLLSGICSLIAASIYPFNDNWNYPEYAKFLVALFAFSGGYSIYYSQQLKFEAKLDSTSEK
jgi:hypothetical protein